MKTNLAPNTEHLAAATAYRRARNCILHAKLSPWTAERELDSARFWLQSAQHHKSMADSVRFWSPEPKLVRQWHFPTWEQELEFLFGSTAAAEVE
jgi:hypothetical protein